MIPKSGYRFPAGAKPGHPVALAGNASAGEGRSEKIMFKKKAMRRRLSVLALMATLATGPVLAQQNSQPSWPPLPTSGFIAGRPATDKDVTDGNAVFALRAYGVPFGKPVDVTIPQYAYLTKSGQPRIPVIVVQAELGKGIKIFGVRDLDGKAATARESELQLLGTKPPN
jgi:hypothetical protein